MHSQVCMMLLLPAGTVLVASAFHVAQLVVGRLVLGVGVGFATQATPLYLSEMAPYKLRGEAHTLDGAALAATLCCVEQGRQVVPCGSHVQVTNAEA